MLAPLRLLFSARVISATFVLCLGRPATLAQSFVFTTFAGQPPQTGAADGPSTEARFWFPTALTVDAVGNVYVADSYNHTIRKITPAGVTTTVAGAARQSGSIDGAALSARFNRPVGIAVDPVGNLYVADTDNHLIRKISGGAVTTLAGSAGAPGSADGTGTAARFNGPWSVVVAPDGSLYVSERYNATIRKINPAGVVTTAAGSAGRNTWGDGVGTGASLSTSSAMAFDPTANLYFIEPSSRTLRKMTPSGVVSTVAGTPGGYQGLSNGTGTQVRFYYPEGLASDAIGNFYISDSLANTLRRMLPSEIVTTFAGSGQRGGMDGNPGTAQFASPKGLGTDAAGNVYVADSGNHSIRKMIVATGAVVTLAGPRNRNGSSDGNGTAARFLGPRGIVGDSKGNLFVCDQLNRTIRRITATGDVTTFAGLAGQSIASVDGVGATARFGQPTGIAVDAADNLYVVDNYFGHLRRITPAGVVTTVATSISSNTLAIDREGNCYFAIASQYVVRKLTPAGVNTIIAGRAGVAGAADGPVAQALFTDPGAIAIDDAGNLYVRDLYAIRKISTSGVVSTLAGSIHNAGILDGTGGSARFAQISGLTFDHDGNLFATDSASTIRKITPAGDVSTVGGAAYPELYTSPEGVGTAARFVNPAGIWISPSGTLFFTDSDAHAVFRGERQTTPNVVTPPQAESHLLGSSVSLSVSATGGGLMYQWKLDGAPILGATNATYSVASVSPADAGRYAVEVTNAVGKVTSAPATLEVLLPGRLINLSVLATLDAADDRLTVGTAVGGQGTIGPKPLLIRGVGPSLATVGVAGAVRGSRLQLFAGSTPITENAGWAGDARIGAISSQVGAFPLASTSSQDAALYLEDATGADRSVTLSGTTAGFVLAELYDATPASAYRTTTPRLINVSVLKAVGSGLTAGFVIGGTTPVNVLVRAIGPSLANFGVATPLTDPKLEVFDRSAASLAVNTAWGGTTSLSNAFKAVGAFALDPGSHDAALLVRLEPGSYTARVTSLATAKGDTLIEVYEVP